MENKKFTFECNGNKLTRESFEVVKFAPYRFIGKTVYARAFIKTGSAEVFKSLWEHSEWIFSALDELKEYATDEAHNAALMTWEKFDEKNELFGYTVGRFMKPNTPVPTDMDYFDTPETLIGKAVITGTYTNTLYDAGGETLCHNYFENQDNYEAAPWKFLAEIYPTDKSPYGFYLPSNLKNPN
ncbi:MAG: hypothetical protein FWE06_09340 [Oscillospiraceae bacterium]|nr:hypothetical protein [Oscillospiraceae bacterium]